MDDDNGLEIIIGAFALTMLAFFAYLPFQYHNNKEYQEKWHKEVKAGIGISKVKCIIVETAHEKRRVPSGLYASRTEDVYLVKARSKTGKIYTDSVSVFDLDHELVGRKCVVSYKVWKEKTKVIIGIEVDDES